MEKKVGQVCYETLYIWHIKELGHFPWSCETVGGCNLKATLRKVLVFLFACLFCFLERILDFKIESGTGWEKKNQWRPSRGLLQQSTYQNIRT